MVVQNAERHAASEPGDAWIAYLGISIWGIGTTVQDSLLVALIAKVTSEDRRATA